MKILFDSQIYPESLLDSFKRNSSGFLDYAAHNLCTALYRGLVANGQEVVLVNVPNLGSFPFLYKSMMVKGTHMDDGVSLPFLNISYIKRFDIKRRQYNYIMNLLDQKGDEDTVLLIYNYRCLSIINSIKEAHPSIKVCMVVTDLPEFMLAPSSKVLSSVKLLGKKRTIKQKDMSCVDGFVLLAEQMREKLGMGDKPWVVVEGIYNSDTSIIPVSKENNKTILYTGDLSKRYGILNLLKAFNQIKEPNYRLWLCGSGDGLPEIKEYASKDSRIIYKGILPRKEVLELQARATVLVNPRQSTDEYVKYSFPSKTMEYLASGTPVIMSHLPSIPSDYDDFLFYINDESIDGLTKKIVEVCSMDIDVLKSHGQKASQFIYNEKSPLPQTKKIVSLLSSLE